MFSKETNEQKVEPNMYTKEELQYLSIPENRIDLAYQLYRITGNILERQGLISIDGDRFAKYCTIISFCESNLDPTAISNGQQGICQLTKTTRYKLGLPLDITDVSIGDQIIYHQNYLLACSPKLLKKVKTVEDLHFLNFKPFGKRFVLAMRATVDLDFDNDGWITPADLKTFQLNRIKENPVIAKMYKEVTNDDTAK